MIFEKETEKGKLRGIVYSKEPKVMDKYVIHLVDEDNNPILHNDKPLQILSSGKKWRQIGYVD